MFDVRTGTGLVEPVERLKEMKRNENKTEQREREEINIRIHIYTLL
jgi:hypothetical protein